MRAATPAQQARHAMDEGTVSAKCCPGYNDASDLLQS